MAVSLNALTSTMWLCNCCPLSLVLGGKRILGPFSYLVVGSILRLCMSTAPGVPSCIPSFTPKYNPARITYVQWSGNVTDRNVAAVYKMLNYSWCLSPENPRAELT